jgi:hypothetical protein
MQAVCLAHHIILPLIILIIFGEEHRNDEASHYSNLSVFEQSVYKFSLIRDAQINTFFFSIYEPIFAYTSSFLSQMDRYSHWEVMGT